MPDQLLSVVEYPDPSLMLRAAPVNLEELDALQGFIDDMMYTMFFHQGVGLAAPQVGKSVRLFIIDQRPINGNKNQDPWVFINPVIEPVTDNRVARKEGCLSFPGLFAKVERSEFVKITAFDRTGTEFTMDASHHHLFSVALQHENDHLEGTLMSDRIKGREKRTMQRWAAKRP